MKRSTEASKDLALQIFVTKHSEMETIKRKLFTAAKSIVVLEMTELSAKLEDQEQFEQGSFPKSRERRLRRRKILSPPRSPAKGRGTESRSPERGRTSAED